MSVFAFPDTNVLMEFRPIHEIEWREFLSAEDDNISIVIAQQVTAELNQHKSGNQRRRRERARRGTKELEQYEFATGIPGRPRVKVQIGLQPPSRAFLNSHHLEPEEGDDRIIGLMLLLKESSPNARFVLVSDDINHRQRARGYGLEALGLPEEERLPPEADPRDQTIKEQQQRIRDMEDVLPKLAAVSSWRSWRLCAPHRSVWPTHS